MPWDGGSPRSAASRSDRDRTVHWTLGSWRRGQRPARPASEGQSWDLPPHARPRPRPRSGHCHATTAACCLLQRGLTQTQRPAGTTRVEPPWPGALPAASQSTGHVPVSCRGRCSPTAGVPGPRLAWGLFSRADSLTESAEEGKGLPQSPWEGGRGRGQGNETPAFSTNKKKKIPGTSPPTPGTGGVNLTASVMNSYNTVYVMGFLFKFGEDLISWAQLCKMHHKLC